jgi:hypothetical protein
MKVKTIKYKISIDKTKILESDGNDTRNVEIVVNNEMI